LPAPSKKVFSRPFSFDPGCAAFNLPPQVGATSALQSALRLLSRLSSFNFSDRLSKTENGDAFDGYFSSQLFFFKGIELSTPMGCPNWRDKFWRFSLGPWEQISVQFFLTHAVSSFSGNTSPPPRHLNRGIALTCEGRKCPGTLRWTQSKLNSGVSYPKSRLRRALRILLTALLPESRSSAAAANRELHRATNL